MEKTKLTRFIEKYHLGGNVNAVVINSDNSKLSTRFITGDKSLLGELSCDNFTFENTELGVYDTEQLSKLLSVLSDDVTYNVAKSNDTAIALEVNDQHSSVNFMLSDKSVINQPPALKQLPDFQVKIKVDRQFITRFISGKGALSDTETFTVLSDGTDTKIVIGYASINTNRVTMPVVTTESSEIKNVSFNANLFKDVLVANKECESATLEVSEGGLARINFKVDDYDVTYYLVAVQDVD